MDRFLQFAWQKILPLWHKPFVGLTVAGLIAITVLLHQTKDPQSLSIYDFILSIFIFLLLTAFWAYTTQTPKIAKGKIGIVIAITTEDETEGKQIQFDLVNTLRQLLTRDSPATKFQLVVLPTPISEQIYDYESANKFLGKTRSHLMIYGQATRRKHAGHEVHVLRLEGIVRHAPIPKDVSTRLSNEFDQALPRRLLLSKDNEPIAFDITSAWVDLSARYIIGLAAHLSGEFEYAERLFLSVETSLRATQQLKPFLRPIEQNLPIHIKQLYRNWLAVIGDNYFATRDNQHVKKGDLISDRLLTRESTDYGGLLFKAIAEFVLRRDIPAARLLVGKCRRVRDVTWRYSLAFLDAYTGDLEAAYKEYRRAFRGEYSIDRLPIECEEFIQIVLDQEPDKTHLHFCLGLINFNLKRDYTAAKTDFQRFLNASSPDKFAFAKKLAQELVAKCDLSKDTEQGTA